MKKKKKKMDNYEDDDTHYCNKCHATINGLDNYVSHRRIGNCRGSDKVVKTVVPLYDCQPSTSVTYPEIPNADDFFSSLELQSSSKTQPTRATELLENRTSKRSSSRLQNEERRKRLRIKEDKSVDELKEELPKEKLSNLLQDDTDDFAHLCIPSLLESNFPELVPTATTTTSAITSKVKHSIATTVQTTSSGNNNAKSDGLDVNKRENKNHQEDEDNDHLRHDDSRESWLEVGEDIQQLNNSSRYDVVEYNDYEQDDESDDSSDNANIADDYSYSESEDDQLDYPPRTHTGGKWKPDGIVHQEDEVQRAHAGGKWKLTDPEDTMVQEDERSVDNIGEEHPPANYTGGKWKPYYSNVEQVCVYTVIKVVYLYSIYLYIPFLYLELTVL